MKTNIMLIIIFSITLISCASENISTPTPTRGPVVPLVTKTVTAKVTETEAIEVVKQTCNSFRTVQFEEPHVNQTLIMSPEDAYQELNDEALTPSVEQFTNVMWFAQLNGKWVGTGTFSEFTKDQPWDICEGLVDANSGEPISSSFRWKKSIP